MWSAWIPPIEGRLAVVKKDSRGLVVSVRISEEEQDKLRAIAKERGTTVSALVRAAALGELSESPRAVTETIGPPRNLDLEHGVAWSGPSGSQIAGNTLTITVGPVEDS
jgi:hypothetical protein